MGNPILNDNVRNAAVALADAGILESFFTGLDTTAMGKMPLGRLGAQIARRSLPLSVHRRTQTRPLGEAARLALTRIPSRMNPVDLVAGRFSVQGRAQAIDRAMARAVKLNPSVTGVYSYEDAALESLGAARQRGLAAIYDLPIGYWRAGHEIFKQEAERRPEWRGTLNGLRDPEWKLERKDEEIRRASHLVVASRFTADTLSHFQGELPPISVIPYGTPTVKPAMVKPAGGPVRVIFVGGLSQRKGIADLLEAIPQVETRVELTLIGGRVGESSALDAALKQHKWIPSLPHPEVLGLIAAHDVLVLPSLFEGFGLVLSEALSQGTPIIATSHTAAPELLEGVDEAGWIVPIRDPEGIAKAIGRLADPELRAHSRQQAQIAARRHSWSAYRAGVEALVLGEFAGQVPPRRESR